MAYEPDGLVEKILVNYRWIFVCLFLLPASFFFEIYISVRSFLIFRLKSAPKQHVKKVKNVQNQVKQWAKEGRDQFICTARPGWQTVSFRQAKYKKNNFKVNVDLVDVLEIHPEKQIVRVEPLVTIGQLTTTLNPLGWTIPVVPELDELTIGGMVMGTGIESSSHKFGLFQHICVEYELVLSDGSVVNCSESENPQLFYAVPWSYGTLGILTAVSIKLVPAKKYVKLSYQPLRNLPTICEAIEKASKDENFDFVEALLFDKGSAVLMTGKMADELDDDGNVNEIGKWYKPWFFKHVEQVLIRNIRDTEFIPLRQYYHRHTRSLFWELQDIIPFGNNPLFRFLFGWLMPVKISFLKLTQTQATKKLYENNHAIQDMLVPMDKFQDSIQKFDELFKIYPVWVCPFLLIPNPGMLHVQKKSLETRKKGALYVDVGVYGVPKVDNFSPVENLRQIEKFVMDAGGFQMLYADTYLTREEFRKMFNHMLYDSLREQLGCKKAFPEVYDKIKRSARE